MNPRNLHPVSKVLVILMAGVVMYVASFTALSPAIAPFPDMAGPMRGRLMMGNFSTSGNIILNGASAGISLAGMLAASLYLFGWRVKQAGQGETRDEFSILKRALTEDEAALLGIVKESQGGITQDSLRFRLDWSKAKVSTMLGNLDRMGLVQRERFGKTYKVHYQEGG